MQIYNYILATQLIEINAHRKKKANVIKQEESCHADNSSEVNLVLTGSAFVLNR